MASFLRDCVDCGLPVRFMTKEERDASMALCEPDKARRARNAEIEAATIAAEAMVGVSEFDTPSDPQNTISDNENV